jgi:hypothetical protein
MTTLRFRTHARAERLTANATLGERVGRAFEWIKKPQLLAHSHGFGP